MSQNPTRAQARHMMPNVKPDICNSMQDRPGIFLCVSSASPRRKAAIGQSTISALSLTQGFWRNLHLELTQGSVTQKGDGGPNDTRLYIALES